jgi:ribosome-associated toxin RatA of RatAB toxin-antitoxin module
VASLSRKFALLGVVLSALMPLHASTPAKAGVSSSSFTAEEWRKLDAGELVLRPSTRQQGGTRLMGGSSWQMIDAAPDAVWRALLDTSHYHKMMPQVLEARVVGKQDNVRTVFLRQGAKGLVEAKYYLRVSVHEERHDITFTVDDSKPREVLRSAWGFYTVRPYRDGRTLLAYGVMADIGTGFMAGIVRSNVHEWMLRTPWLIKRFLEGSGRKLYVR